MIGRPDDLRPMSEAPTARSTWVALWYEDRFSCYPVAAHYAQDLSGEEQPPFKGWFQWTGPGCGFHGAPESPIGWTPIEAIAALSQPTNGAVERDWVADAALNTSRACGYYVPPDGERSEDGRGIGHAFWMLAEVAYRRVADRKAHRWLGYAQGILVEHDLLTLNEAKQANKRASDEARATPSPQPGEA